jgi:DNA-damage-inducible protein J
MTASVMVHVRVPEDVKTQAAQTLASMGLSVSDAVRVFLTRIVAEQQLPFALKVPNATTRAAMAEADEIIKARRARFATADELFDELEKNSRQSAEASQLATCSGLRQGVPQGLGAPVAFRPVRHEEAEGSDSDACRQRWADAARMA